MVLNPTLKRLLACLADGGFHSGTELAIQTGISRAAVCKQLHALQELGIDCSAVSGKGYKLAKPLALLDAERIVADLDDQVKPLLTELKIFDSLPSTNTYLAEQAHTLSFSGLACLAEQQTAGKGRRGRQWVSPFGHNIYLSLLWHYAFDPAALSGMSLAVGVAAIKALTRFGVRDVGLKWPNDIYWQERKLGGILIEVSGESGGPCHAIVGLGLNLFVPPVQGAAITQDWVDLSHVVGDGVLANRNQLAALLLSELLAVVAKFDRGALAAFLPEWRQYDCLSGRQVDIFIGELGYRGHIAGIDDEGLLLLRDGSGRIKAFASGEVSFRKS